MSLKGKDFLKLLDYTPDEITELLDLAADLKAKKKAGIVHRLKEGKNIALIFEKTSTRTRCSFEVAAQDLGMCSTYLGPTGSQIGVKESMADTARVLSRMYDAIEYRGFEQSRVEELAKYAEVPVINGLTNEFHPTQILADFLTIREHFGKLEGIKLVYMGDARYNMGDSLMVWCAKMGMHFVACAPKSYFPNEDLVKECEAVASQTGAVIELNEEEMGEFNEMIRILLVGGYREAHRDGRDRGLGEMLRDAYEKQVQVLEAGDEQAYIEKAIAFDGCFVQVTGNERLINIYENASYLFYLFVRHTYWKELDNREKKLAEHRVLIDAVEKGDGPLVERLLEEHYDEHYNMM